MSISCLASNVLTLNSTLFSTSYRTYGAKRPCPTLPDKYGYACVCVTTFTPQIQKKKKKSIFSFAECICDALRDFEPFVQFKNVKNRHGGVLLLVKL